MRNNSLSGIKFFFLFAVTAHGVVAELVSSSSNPSGMLVQASKYTGILFYIALIGTILAIINNLEKISLDAYQDPDEAPDEDVEKSW